MNAKAARGVKRYGAGTEAIGRNCKITLIMNLFAQSYG